jgi:thioredoxin reductase (NADPH)
MSKVSADVGIIGAGPIGIELAIALKRAGIDYLHFDARQIGHTISWFAPQTRFFSSNERIAIAGVPLVSPDQTKSTREQYLAYLRMIVEMFDLDINLYEPVVGIHRQGGQFLLSTRKGGVGHQYTVAKLVLATGGTERPRRVGVSGEDLPHVSHYFQDPHAYFRQDLLIVGGRNSAVEAALRCHHTGARVSVSYRKPKFDAASIKYWLWPEMNGLIQSGKIRTYFDSSLVEIRQGSAILNAAGMQEPLEAKADFVLLLVGYEADMTLCRMAGVELRTDQQAPVFNPETMETNVPGIFVAGTAISGTQDHYAIFLENCHVHCQRIVAAISGIEVPIPAEEAYERPES